MRLAEGMTYKWAAMDFRYGGGKSVLAVPGPLAGERRRSLFTRLGHLMNALNGGYGVGEDLGTTPEDMAFLATITPWVACTSSGGEAPDPGPFTAEGVHAGIEAAVAHLEGAPDLAGVWDFRSLTPFERPENLAGKTTLNDEDAAVVLAEADETWRQIQ